MTNDEIIDIIYEWKKFMIISYIKLKEDLLNNRFWND